MEPDRAKCPHCGTVFTPRHDTHVYCRPTCKKAASRRRRRCLWCGTAFLADNELQQYCCPGHKSAGTVCREKEAFLTEEAAAATARRRTVPGLHGVIGHYRCPRPDGEPHWHLRSEDKRRQKRHEQLQAKWAARKEPA